MKRFFFFIVAIVMVTMAIQAQIPVEVKEVMAKCKAVMEPPEGLEYTMDMKLAMGPVGLTNTHLSIAAKGEKERIEMVMKVVGVEATMLSGYDGKESWSVQSSSQSDSIHITRSSKEKRKSDERIDFGLADEFKKAKMRLKDGYYEIDFSDPKDKDSEIKKLSVKVSAKDYYLREMRTSAHGVRVVMKITKIRVGLKDDYFKLDLKKFPNAIVVWE